jgi:subtilisin-like proprotein convertase family protein
MSQCSQSTPKPINDLQITIDTIHISQSGNIKEVKVLLNINHSNDGDLFVKLSSPSGSSILTQYNGANGQNYTNTIFDDTAHISITQGTPPFTGRYKPQSLLSAFNNTQSEGDWVLLIYDKSSGNQGTLLNWCLQIVYENTVGISEISNKIPGGFVLFQNYPNPFNPNTVISFDLPKTGYVNLKVFDLLGREISTLINENLKAGNYQYTFKASALPSGIYFYTLNSGDFNKTQKMILVK